MKKNTVSRWGGNLDCAGELAGCLVAGRSIPCGHLQHHPHYDKYRDEDCEHILGYGDVPRTILFHHHLAVGLSHRLHSHELIVPLAVLTAEPESVILLAVLNAT